MINLLPPQEKKELELEEIKRLVIILGSIILAFLISFVLLLYALQIQLESQLKTRETILGNVKKEAETSEAKELEAKIATLNKNVSELAAFYKKGGTPGETLEILSKLKPKGLYFTNLAFTKTKTLDGKTEFKITVSGFAPTRDILLSLKENLENEEKFQDIDFPAKNWVKPTNIDFQFSFTVKTK